MTRADELTQALSDLAEWHDPWRDEPGNDSTTRKQVSDQEFTVGNLALDGSRIEGRFRPR